MNEIKYRKPEEMKESGVEWLGTIPREWNVKKLKYIVILRNEKRKYENKTTYIGLENIESKTGRFIKEPNDTEVIIDGICNVFKQRDVLFGKLRPYLAKCLYVESDGYCSSELLVFCAKGIKYKLLMYHLLNEKFINLVDSSTYGAKMPRASWDYVGNIKLATPNLECNEQQKITNYLSIKTAQFDSITTKKERLIEKLEEAKKSLISEVVTGKVKIVDGKIVKRQPEEIKDSGVEWLGTIPKDFAVKKLKYIASVKGRIGFRGYTTDDLVEEDDGALTIGATHITSNGHIDLSAPIYIRWDKYFESPEIMISIGDILLVQRGSTTGKVGIIESLPKEATINPSLIIIKNKQFVLSKFLFYYLKSEFITSCFNAIISNTAIPMISQEQALNIEVVLPDISTQQVIIHFLNLKVNQYDNVIDAYQTQIQKLNQAKQSLISEAVTGKIDLRDWKIIKEGAEP